MAEVTRSNGPLSWIEQGIENQARWDAIAARLGKLGASLDTSQLGPGLRGDWLGHALHPVLTDLPLGCWISAGLLDVVGGRSGRRASRRLVGLGLVAAVPAMASGLVELAHIDDERLRRVGAVHATGNVVVGMSYLCSWRARRHQHMVRAKAWAAFGGALGWGTAYLGGHLSFGRGVGVGPRPGEEPPGDGATAQGESGSADSSTTDGDRRIDEGDLVDLNAAAALLETTTDEVLVMVSQGLLTPTEDGANPRFARYEVAAVGLIGG